MRIDRFLHCIRLAKSRTLAQAIVEQGHVRIDGKRALKSSEEVRVGSVVGLPLHGQVPHSACPLAARAPRTDQRGARLLRRAGN